ncbi:hypothetical protein KSP39_PZI020283 [Platanthera zijinensis]|uniref:Ribosomal protein L34Ae n=1 Tax=Platanthera zijinensis TaxID=2320716 RepID=A0AAP0FXD7_9ASPA
MDLFLTFCLIFLTSSLLIVFRFLALHVLRSEDLISRPLDGVRKAQHKDGMEESKAKGFPWFSFMFHHQFFKQEEIPVTAMEQSQSSLTSPDMCSFWSENDFNGYIEEAKGMNNQVQESFFQLLEECNFDADEDIRYFSSEDFQRSNDENILGLAQLEKQIFEEKRFNSFCSDTSSVGEKGDSFIMEVLSGFDSDIGLVIDSDYDNFKYDGYHGDSEHDSKIRETLTRKNYELVESNEAKEDEQEENYERRKESKSEELPFAKNCSESIDNIEEEDSEPKSENSGINEIRKSSNIASNAPSYVSYEKQHTILDNEDEKQLPKLEKERTKETCSYVWDEEELDEMWEHQDLIEQLKMELRKARAVGLPTILEESENSKEFEDSKTLKINDNSLHENLMDELHKFYKCYEDRMKKFDGLNYQKMYATGFLHLNDPLELRKTLRPMFSTIIYHVSRNFLPICIQKSGHDPSEKFIKKLRCDLETIYVGQTCLSWEYLRWQYEKLHELSDFDSVINHQYNNVAAEFQQFKVTLQRFVENEPFQGPRIANYAKQRCILRNFLQSPVVKEDSLIDEVGRKKYEDVITREKLEEIMEEAMRVLWEFVRAETYETPRCLKGLVLDNLVELLDPSDHEFMVDIRASLQKKEKKLKDLLKAGNCFVKKFKKRQEHRSSKELFFSQVDLKLVSRVLNLSMKTSDQLIWCHKKLSKISFSGRKLHREPSILLFPC